MNNVNNLTTPFRSIALSLALLGTALLTGNPALADFRDAPVTAFDDTADVSGWFTFRDPNNPNNTVMAMNTNGLAIASNGPTYFPFNPELLYEMLVDNNHDAVPDITVRFRFSSLDNGVNTTDPIRESYTGFMGISGSNCFGGVTAFIPGALPAFFNIPKTCTSPASSGHPAPVNAPAPSGNFGSTGFVIQPPITTISPVSSGLGLGQVYTMTILNSHIGALICSAGPFNALPANVGARTINNYANLHYGQSVFSACGGQVFAGTTDDPYTINLGAFFDTLNLPEECGAGANPLFVETTQGQTGSCAPSQVDGMNVNTISVSLPTSIFTGNPGTSPIIGTYARTTRARMRVLSTIPGVSASFVGPGNTMVPDGPFAGSTPPQPGDSSRVQIGRKGNPLFNELIVGNGCKDRFSMEEPHTDALLNGCNFNDGKGSGAIRPLGSTNGSYPDITAFLLKPVLARVLNALVERTVAGNLIGYLEAPNASSPSGVSLAGSSYQCGPTSGIVGRRDMTVLGCYGGWIREMNQLGVVPPTAVVGSDPVADLLRIDTRTPATSIMTRRRMGPLDNFNPCLLTPCPTATNAPDKAGWPNGRRPSDDVLDGVMRVTMGALDSVFLNSPASNPFALRHAGNLVIGDATQGNDYDYRSSTTLMTDNAGYATQFPYFAPSQDGVRHRTPDPLEPGCALSPGNTPPPAAPPSTMMSGNNPSAAGACPEN